MVSRTRPLLSSTSTQPALDVAACPFLDGVLPTKTQFLMITKAVVSPIPPGQGPGRPRLVMWANRILRPLGLISTIVDPVPCRFFELLKLLTSTLFLCSLPWLALITATP